MYKFTLNPLTRKRLKRFRQTRQAWYSFILLSLLFLMSLGAEFLCNSRPLAVCHDGRWYFPIFKFYPEDSFLHNGNSAEPDYLKLKSTPSFLDGGGRMYFPPNTNDPYRIVPPEELQSHLRVRYYLSPRPGVAGIAVDKELRLVRQTGLDSITGRAAPPRGTALAEILPLTPELQTAIRERLTGLGAFPRYSAPLSEISSGRKAVLTIAARKPRRRLPRSVRITIREEADDSAPLDKGWLLPGTPLEKQQSFLNLPVSVRKTVKKHLGQLSSSSPDLNLELEDNLSLSLHKESVRYPFRPVPGHPFGIDDAGRDILARILYGLRSSLLFGLILVFCSMTLGTAAGMLQGYLGGWFDISAQRLIEIWSALPFLYVIILLGSIYGTSFPLLIFCYALFNWIGISYYMRAEMLRLRKMPYVEAAHCLGLPGWKIAWKHILPNAMVPLITFFPFSLVGAIGSLAALDYLGFGLPPPTPSLGQLLQQAQNQRWAYWLILYPAVTLFLIMLLGVFIGEGFRNAYDPRKQNRIH